MKKIGEFLGRLGKKGKLLVSICVVSAAMASMSLACFAAQTEPPAFDLGSSISKVGPKLMEAFGLIITSCIDLAIGLVPIGLAFIGVTMLIKKGKGLMKTAA